MNAFCPLSIVPVRSTPSDAAEMVNQLLFGEQIVILEDKNNWVFIESVLDKYKGWVDKKQVKVLERPLIPNYIVRKAISINLNINHPDYFLAGSYLQAKDIEAYNINLDDCQLLRESISSNKLSTVDYAQQFLNAPYLWGGRSIFGIDCSGLTQIAFRLAGFNG